MSRVVLRYRDGRKIVVKDAQMQEKFEKMGWTVESESVNMVAGKSIEWTEPIVQKAKLTRAQLSDAVARVKVALYNFKTRYVEPAIISRIKQRLNRSGQHGEDVDE